jgi:uncharacterized damage-inducible protein DinB
LADGRAEIVAFMERMHRETTAILEGLAPTDLERKIASPQGAPITAWKLLRAMIEHEIHHRGEIYIYLALLGAPRPPLACCIQPPTTSHGERSSLNYIYMPPLTFST